MKDNLPLNYGACHTFLQNIVAVADKYPLMSNWLYFYLPNPAGFIWWRRWELYLSEGFKIQSLFIFNWNCSKPLEQFGNLCFLQRLQWNFQSEVLLDCGSYKYLIFISDIEIHGLRGLHISISHQLQWELVTLIVLKFWA